MAQITWRNVANTVTGNPAAALSAASSAFANVGARSDKMLQAAIARDELAQKNLTDDATQRIFGKGELAGIDKGAGCPARVQTFPWTSSLAPRA